MNRFDVDSAYVISLPGSDRRDHFFDQAGSAEFRIFDAFDGHQPEVVADFDADMFERCWGSPPTPGQVGCCLSHTRVIADFAASEGEPEDWMLVAEDDVVFLAGTPAVVNTIVSTPAARDVIVLSDNWSRLPRPDLHRRLSAESQVSFFGPSFRAGAERFRAGRFAGRPWSAAFYLVSRAGARRHVEFVQTQPGGRPWWLADDWTLLRQEAGLDIAICRPSAVDFLGGSTTRTAASMAQDMPHDHAQKTSMDRIKTAIALRSRLRSAQLTLAAGALDLRARRTP